jgi:hypothetical protein
MSERPKVLQKQKHHIGRLTLSCLIGIYRCRTQLSDFSLHKFGFITERAEFESITLMTYQISC